MKYDFDEIVPRRGTNAIKWDMDTDPEVLPMWVADMDFRTAPAVAAALKRRVQHDIFGYATAPKAYYDAITGWFRRRHGWQIRPEWVLHTTGVIPALSAVIKALTQPGDKVLIQTPVYNHFFTSIHNSGCQAAESPLVYRDNTYTIDFDDLERKAADPAVKLMLLCNPHNPAGRVWTPAELRRIGELCLRHDVVVVADEIHCELVMPGFSYTPFASLCEEFERSSVTCTSPSKAFNLAGLQVANIFAADAALRARIGHSLQINETGEIGPLAIEALIAAYDEGAEWLDALNEYLHDN
ncbi:MAG: pyridoxal phosphate-dependent aminotransferase, partial [Alistipes onderdonkii]|nr:pyridoxal phosphate-dependent aminotransferase [Alistipes onderdonkii]